jgi:hypothetical protein
MRTDHGAFQEAKFRGHDDRPGHTFREERNLWQPDYQDRGWLDREIAVSFEL